MNYFKVKSKKKLAELEIGDKVEESDFATLTNDGTFVQLEYVQAEDSEVEKYDVKPGVFTIVKTMTGLKLETTSFVKDVILESFVSTKEITDKIDCFFRNLDKYKKWGIEIPKRGVLLWGPAGTGKSTALTKVCKTYAADERTIIVVWPTDKFEAHHVKDFIKSFNYVGVDKMILIAEDIGGTEIDQARMRSDSSLLSLLDNQEKTFTIPILIIATTNFPENFMSNLTNRPGRFDDKIKVGYPPNEARGELLKFFAKDEWTQDAVDLMSSNKCKKFAPAHIRDVVIRSSIFEKGMVDVINEMIAEIEDYEKQFSEKANRGMGF